MKEKQQVTTRRSTLYIIKFFSSSVQQYLFLRNDLLLPSFSCAILASRSRRSRSWLVYFSFSLSLSPSLIHTYTHKHIHTHTHFLFSFSIILLTLPFLYPSFPLTLHFFPFLPSLPPFPHFPHFSSCFTSFCLPIHFLSSAHLSSSHPLSSSHTPSISTPLREVCWCDNLLHVSGEILWQVCVYVCV